MIECYDKNIYHCKRKHKKKRLLSFFLIFIIIISFFCYYRFVVVQNIYNICSNSIYSLSAEQMDKAVLLSTMGEVDYDNLITIGKDNDGNITLIKTNSLSVNSLNRKVANKTSELIKSELENGVSLPILSFSGIGIISGLGPCVNFKTITLSSVICDFITEFTSSGINQTIHSLYLNIKCENKISLPLYSNTITCCSKILIGETVLVGKVPDIYLNGKIT